MVLAPQTEDELMCSALSLAGKTLGDIARQHHIPVPENLKREKGWVGELLEVSLGATAKNLPEPDFQYIGVELKTIPLNKKNKAKESTYVCTTPLNQTTSHSWEQSIVRKKLKRVLWIPVEADNNISPEQRKVGMALLWSPDNTQESKLKADWTEIMERIWMGELESIDASLGECLQLRPKAAHGKVLSETFNAEGESIMTLPRGFYLRSAFTNEILQTHYLQSHSAS